ncbi:hypothetical protein FB45DRAFT_1059968 [Roridomyces roridus]|uniref:BTB domain-containing protein n=1 Tax=Roridomyces roridus TaxID=1738132 RepID=A0AAD7FLP4_9AGAR|nr:hypothetical protein FB45DRAFT_1059968 [Roridomyces roridus]
MEDDSTPPFVLAAPFDNIDGDVILRSSDGIDFRLHRVVLSLASGFSKQMFSLPQPDGDPQIPVIPMAESATLLDKALRLWYPGATPIGDTTLDELRDILDVTIAKYDIQFVVPAAKGRLREHMSTDPVGTFILACRHEWKDVALEAARRSLAYPIRSFGIFHPQFGVPSPSTQLKYATADTYHSLLSYHARCTDLATQALQCPGYDEVPGEGCQNDDCTMDPTDEFSRDEGTESITLWLSACLKLVEQTISAAPTAHTDMGALRILAREGTEDCDHCSTRGIDQLASFLAEMRSRIDSSIDQVPLTVNF